MLVHGGGIVLCYFKSLKAYSCFVWNVSAVLEAAFCSFPCKTLISAIISIMLVVNKDQIQLPNLALCHT